MIRKSERECIMALININNLKKAYGTNILFEDISFEIGEGDKLGLVGINGAGKTTLFKIITGQEGYDGGELFKHKLTSLGYMEQQLVHTDDTSVYEELLSIFEPLITLEEEIEKISRLIEVQGQDVEILVKRQHSLAERFEAQGGFLYRSRVRAMLLGLGFAQVDLEKPVRLLSGGQKTRIMLGKMLLSSSNLLLLDEPTNHLDINSVEWLEGFLKDYSGAFIVISHDRYFLDRVTNRTLSLENQKLTVYNGNYSYYVDKKALDDEILRRKYDNTQREINRIEGIIEQQKRWNREKNIKTAESKQKVVDKLEKTLEKPNEQADNIRFKFTTKKSSSKDVLIINDLEKSFENKQLFKDLNMHITKGERVFLLGPNGCGKTTIFKIITDKLKADSGSFKFGASIEPGYYDQTQSDLDYNKTALAEVWDAYPSMTQTQIRNAMATFLYKGDDVNKQISMLSGGERARLSLLKLMLSQANLLLLDEPTNHLDISSCEALENAFADYDGTLLIISHDRYFINKMADKIYYLSSNGVTEYLGNYDYFVEKHIDIEIKEKSNKPKENEYKQKKEAQAAKRRISGQISRIEEQISVNEQEIKKMESSLINPEIAADYVKVTELSKQIEDKQNSLQELYEQWEVLHNELENME